MLHNSDPSARMSLASTGFGLEAVFLSRAGHGICYPSFEDPALGTVLAVKSTWYPEPHSHAERPAMQTRELVDAGHFLGHLAQISWADAVSAQAQDAGLLRNTSYICLQSLNSQHYLPRIAIEKESHTLGTLPSPPHFAQVFFDILNCHKLLYDNHCSLYGDVSLSMSNITWRFDDEGHIYGVLNDMDLSPGLENSSESKTISFRRTDTPPYMAIDLLRKDSYQPEHIYRHDLESLFYVMLTLVTCYQLETVRSASFHTQGRLRTYRLFPFREWFDPHLSWATLSAKKHFFITFVPGLNHSLHLRHIIWLSFQSFTSWISQLKNALSDGLYAYDHAVREAEEAIDRGEAPASFDYETLGGHFQYSTFFEVMKNFEGEPLRLPANYHDAETAMEL